MTGNKKILLVDDEAVVQSLCRRVLTKMGYDLTIASNIKEALAEIQKLRNLNMLITDIGLPDGDVIEVILKVRQKYPNAKLLMITGSIIIPQEKIAALQEIGINENNILFKPFEINVFETTIRENLDGK